jgi:hypothetical protein
MCPAGIPRRMSLLLGRWRFLPTNGDYNFVGFFAVTLVCALIVLDLCPRLIGDLVLDDCSILVVVDLLICLFVHFLPRIKLTH